QHRVPGDRGSTPPIHSRSAHRSRGTRSSSRSSQASLTEEVGGRSRRHVTARLAGNRDDTGLVWMSVDAVASALTLEFPAVRLDQPDHVANLHAAREASKSALLGANASASSFVSSPRSRWWM